MSAVAQVEVTLKDNLSGKLKDATQAVKETADAEKKAAQVAKELAKEQEQIAKAARRLEDLANRGNDISRLATELRRTKAEITELARKTGDEATAARATAAAEAQFAAKLQALQDAQKQAAAGADDLASAEGRAADAAKDSAKKIEEFSDSAEHAGQSAGEAKNKFGDLGDTGAKLSSVLGLISPELGEAAQGLGDLTDFGEGAAMAAEAFGLSAGSLMTILGPVAIAIAGVALVYKELSNQAEDAEKKIEASRKRLEELQQAANQYKLAQADLETQLALANGEITEAEAAGRAAEKMYRDNAKALGDWHDAEVESAKARLASYDAMRRERDEQSGVIRDFKAEAAERQRLAEALDAANRLRDAHIAKIEKESTEAGFLAERSMMLSEAERASSESTKEATQTSKDNEQAIKDRAEAIKLLADTIASADPVSQENRRYELQVQSIQEAIRLSGDQEEGQRALNVALAEHEERLQAIADQQKKKAEDAEKAAAAEKKQIQDAAQAEQDRLRKEAELKARLAAEEEARKRQKATGTVDMVGSVMGGGFAALGWIGQIIQAVIGLVTGIVDETGNGIIDKLHETMMEFFSDLGGLGAELADSMLRSVVEGIPAAFQGIAGLLGGLLAEDSLKAILEGSARMIPEILVAIFRLIIADVPRIVAELIRTIFSKEFWVDVLKGFADGIKEAFKGLVGANSDQSKGGRVVAGVATLGLSEALRAATKGRYATGAGNIREDGLYYLHKGETAIVPSNGVQPSSRPSGGGINVVVNISGYMASNTEDLARTIRQAVNRGIKLA